MSASKEIFYFGITNKHNQVIPYLDDSNIDFPINHDDNDYKYVLHVSDIDKYIDEIVLIFENVFLHDSILYFPYLTIEEEHIDKFPEIINGDNKYVFIERKNLIQTEEGNYSSQYDIKIDMKKVKNKDIINELKNLERLNDFFSFSDFELINSVKKGHFSSRLSFLRLLTNTDDISFLFLQYAELRKFFYLSEFDAKFIITRLYMNNENFKSSQW